MATKNLTSTSAAAAKPRPGKSYWLWSKDLRGFGLKVQPTGSRSYYHVARINGAQKFTQIAAYDAIPFDEAFALAQELGVQATRARKIEGATFQPEKLVKPDEPARGPLLLGEAWAFYFDRHLKSKASAADAQKKISANVAKLLQRPVNELAREEVISALKGIEAVGVRRHVLQSLKAACNFCADENPKASHWPVTLANPFRGVKVPKLDPRTRKLTGTDLVNFGKAAAAFEDATAGTFLLGLTVSGARLNELREARVHEWDSKRRRLRLAKSRMKADRPGVLVFGPAVAARIDALVKDNAPGAAIFPGGDPQGFRDFRKPLTAVLKAAECRTVTPHDLRRSCAGALVTAGFDHALIHQYLNHKPDDVTLSYLTLDHDDERRDAMAAAVEVALGLSKPARALARREGPVAKAEGRGQKPARATQKPAARRAA